MAMEYFNCYHNYRRKMARLSDQEVGRLFRALLAYSETGEPQELTGREGVAFDFIADDIDYAKRKYAEKCAQNAQNRKSKTGEQQESTDADERQRPTTDVIDRGQPLSTVDERAIRQRQKTEDKDNILPTTTPACAREVPDVFALQLDPEFGRAMTTYFAKIGPDTNDRINAEMKHFSGTMGADCCIRAMDLAIEANAVNWNYVRKILQEKEKQGVKCLADWDRLDAEYQAKKKATGKTGGKKQSEGIPVYSTEGVFTL